jgi:hypothetical protein
MQRGGRPRVGRADVQQHAIHTYRRLDLLSAEAHASPATPALVRPHRHRSGRTGTGPAAPAPVRHHRHWSAVGRQAGSSEAALWRAPIAVRNVQQRARVCVCLWVCARKGGEGGGGMNRSRKEKHPSRLRRAHSAAHTCAAYDLPWRHCCPRTVSTVSPGAKNKGNVPPWAGALVYVRCVCTRRGCVRERVFSGAHSFYCFAVGVQSRVASLSTSAC